MLTKNFKRLNKIMDEPLKNHFTDRLVGDIMKLCLSPSQYLNCVFSCLGFCILIMLPVEAQAQVELDEAKKILRDKYHLTLEESMFEVRLVALMNCLWLESISRGSLHDGVLL